MSKKTLYLAAMREDIGFIEGPRDNETPYGAHTGHQFEPWCGSARDTKRDKVGISKKDMPDAVYTPACAEKWKGMGRYRNPATYEPKPGDDAFFIFEGKIIQHIGSVIRNNGDGTVTVSEGNTSPDKKVAGSQNNGGEWCMKVRAYRADNKRKLPVYIVGFGEPDWSKIG